MSESDDSDLTFREAVAHDFGTGFMKGFAFMVLFAAVAARLYIGVRQRLARERNIINVDPDLPSR